MTRPKRLIFIYFLALALEILGNLVFNFKSIPYGIWTFKPLLMPILMYWYYKETGANTNFDKIIIASLFFSWWGDNFLMPNLLDPAIGFLLGLASFLIAHLLYAAAFLNSKLSSKSLIKSKPYLVIPFVLLVLGLISFLNNQNMEGFAAMKMPILVYASVIMIMVLSALNRFEQVNTNSFKLVFLGAILFMVSDSVIALNRFSQLFNNIHYIADILIMVLYGLGQYYIVKGCSLQHGNGE